MKYHLGCGSTYLEGYVNVDFPQDHHDVNDNVRADIYTDILTMQYEKCDEIKSHHFFEHFNYYDTFVLLYKWTEALNVDGKLIIDVPDLEELCKAYLAANSKTKFLVARYLFGSHEADWAYHINGWSKDTLAYVLSEIEYVVESVNKYGEAESEQPNCGITIVAVLKKKLDEERLKEKLDEVLGLYRNGGTEFENKLWGYWKEKFENGIVR